MTTRTLKWVWMLGVPPVGFLIGLLLAEDIWGACMAFAISVSVMQFGLMLKERVERKDDALERNTDLG